MKHFKKKGDIYEKEKIIFSILVVIFIDSLNVFYNKYSSNETLTETPSLTLVSSTWDGENDIVFNVQAKDTKVELLEMYIYSNGSSIGSIYVKPDKAVDDSGNGTITISNNELKNIKTLLKEKN